jgi:hypothetical protein
MTIPSKSIPIFERVFEIHASLGMAQNQLIHEVFYMSRLLGARDRDEALALLDDWLAELGDSTPTLIMVGAFALYGDTRTALELKSRAERPGVPFVRFLDELSEALLASALGQFDEADRHLATMASVVPDFAIPRGEPSCLIGFAKVALDRGDYARTSRLLGAFNASVSPGNTPFRSHTGALVYLHCTGVLQDVLDPETARATQVEGAALSVKEALDAELLRTATTGAP